MNRTGLELVFASDSIGGQDAWQIVRPLFDPLSGSKGLRLDDQRVKVDRVERLVLGSPGFDIVASSGAETFFGAASYFIDVIKLLGVFDWQDPRVDEVVGNGLQLDGFVSARVYDTEFEHWQNEKSLRVYRKAGRSVEGLPVIEDPVLKQLPASKEWHVVDTSRNPGRRVGRRGYQEVVGNRMWLGPTFFALAGSDEEAISQLALEVRDAGRARRFTFSSTPFVDAHQPPEALRNYLYPQG